ncbi:MAG: hypothetical protein WCE44_09075 [Candidatus Velthaea sp.]
MFVIAHAVARSSATKPFVDRAGTPRRSSSRKRGTCRAGMPHAGLTLISQIANNYVMADMLTAFAHYRVKAGSEGEFTAILARHWKTLHALELVSDEPARVYLGEEKRIPGPFFMEIFEWRDAGAPERAHEHPAVSELWESIGALCESRGGKPMFEFPNGRRIALPELVSD